MKIFVTGAKGFVGKNLICRLKNSGYDEIYEFSHDDNEEVLEKYTKDCDFVFHTAGVNRPQNESEFNTGNTGLTGLLLEMLENNGNAVPVLMPSSTQAELDNPYGRSKKAAEKLVSAYGRKNDVSVYIYRMPNIFGKWSRPAYNSAVATFCHNIARGLPVTVNDADHMMTLAYIDDVAAEFIYDMENTNTADKSFEWRSPACPVYMVSLGKVADIIASFPEMRKNLQVPDMSDPFTSKLYSTYLSFLPEDGFAYPLKMCADERGSFTEFIRTEDRGQFSVNVSHPGVIKGQHWHDSKNEKFLVVKGKGLIRFRKIGEDKVMDYHVSDDKLEAVDIPTGYTHCIINEGDSDMVTLMWANEPFDPAHPDTYRENV